MKKILIFSLIIILATGAIVVAIRFLSGSEDTWICTNGEWIKHGNPSVSKPLGFCGIQAESPIKLETPKPGDIVKSPLAIKGEARGTWFFEGSFPIVLVGSDGQIINKDGGFATAKSDWMTEDFVPFEAELKFEMPTVPEGFLILKKDNPSGLPENDAEIRIPVQFETPGEMRMVKVYFNNNNLDPDVSCDKVFPVEREIKKTPAIASATLEELLKGVTVSDRSKGYYTNINEGVAVQSLVISNGIARVDFSDDLEYQVGGSCRVSAIRAQIIETLKQFVTVQDVIISINGRMEDILQP